MHSGLKILQVTLIKSGLNDMFAVIEFRTDVKLALLNGEQLAASLLRTL